MTFKKRVSTKKNHNIINLIDLRNINLKFAQKININLNHLKNQVEL